MDTYNQRRTKAYITLFIVLSNKNFSPASENTVSASMNSIHVSPFSYHHRAEADSINCLVGGGFFTGRYNSMNAPIETGSRFDPERAQGKVRKLMLIIIRLNIWRIVMDSITVRG
jgi:hypothetical protein